MVLLKLNLSLFEFEIKKDENQIKFSIHFSSFYFKKHPS
jgi:hypothetical protein